MNMPNTSEYLNLSSDDEKLFELNIDDKLNTDNFDIECESCKDIFKMKNSTECTICESSICLECSKERNIISLREWLQNCPNKCTICNKIGCGNCINTCHYCQNIGENFDFFVCDDCSNLELIDCKYHWWYVCQKHYDVQCPECHANRNYDAKYNIL
jgi:hypothetical protein